MLIECFDHRCVFETLPGGLFIRVPFIGQLCFIDRMADWDTWKTLMASGELVKPRDADF